MYQAEAICKHQGEGKFNWVIVITDTETDEARELKRISFKDEVNCLRVIKNWFNDSERLRADWDSAKMIQAPSL